MIGIIARNSIVCVVTESRTRGGSLVVCLRIAACFLSESLSTRGAGAVSSREDSSLFNEVQHTERRAWHIKKKIRKVARKQLIVAMEVGRECQRCRDPNLSLETGQACHYDLSCYYRRKCTSGDSLSSQERLSALRGCPGGPSRISTRWRRRWSFGVLSAVGERLVTCDRTVTFECFFLFVRRII